ncbi:MAG: acyloxyacyl hydrolase [Candidatus Adiutrix sp.]|jgi:hypothetical protein|nr:acyloxyacyl hydrolase [Candidatus Adiutrix sp.]
MIKNKLPVAGLLFLVLSSWTVGAAAEDTALRAGVSAGTHSSTSFDLYLQHSFEPWLDRAGYQLSPYANLGFTLWTGDKKDYPGARNDQIWGLVAALGLRWELKAWETARPYLAFNVGPSYISKDEFLGNEMGGGHYLFNLRASLGLRLGRDFRHNLGLDASHYSNAFTQSSNKGYNALGLSYGYSFW